MQLPYETGNSEEFEELKMEVLSSFVLLRAFPSKTIHADEFQMNISFH